MKKWKAIGGETSRIIHLIFTAPDEETAERDARNYFGNDDFDLEPYEGE